MDKFSEYLKDMKLKRRTMGGLDEEDVLSHIKELRDLAKQELDTRDAEILEMRSKLDDADKQIEHYQASYQEVKGQLSAAQEQLGRYQTSYQAIRDSNSQLDERIRQLGKEPERYQEARGRAEEARLRYDEKYRELESAVKVFHNLERDVEAKVRNEVRESLRDEEERTRAAMRARIEEERAAAGVEIDRLKNEIASLREESQKLSESLRARRERLNQQLTWLNRQLDLDDGAFADTSASEVDCYRFRGTHATLSSDTF